MLKNFYIFINIKNCSYLTFTYTCRWTSCKGRCGETGFMSRYRGNITSSVVQSCELNREWKTCRVLGCAMVNYTESVEGNELRTQELNYIKKNLKNVNRGVLEKCMSDDHCDYHTVKSIFANDTVNKPINNIYITML